MFLTAAALRAATDCFVIADSARHTPLPNASVFDSRGKAIGMSDSKGRTPYIAPADYPVTVRYLGFGEKIVDKAGCDTLFLRENDVELPEVVVETKQQKALHMLAYIREYSTLSTYTDTVFLFREKMVDYMLVQDNKSRFKGWFSPRLLKSKSYYRFTNDAGLDSVSDVSNQHFSWSDWIGVTPAVEMPPALQKAEIAADTVFGKYSPAEIWTRNNDKVSVAVNVLADIHGRKWVPELSGFFMKNLDFENFRIRFNYDNVAGESVTPQDLTGYSYNIESNGRGRDMFMFNRIDEPFYVNTYAEVYILDKEYITIKEAKKWESHKFGNADIDIFEPTQAPPLQPVIQLLVDRVNNIDRDQVRLAIEPDQQLVGRLGVNKNFGIGNRLLFMLKQLTGIGSIKSHRAMKKQWDDFSSDRRNRNNHPQ